MKPTIKKWGRDTKMLIEQIEKVERLINSALQNTQSTKNLMQLENVRNEWKLSLGRAINDLKHALSLINKT